MENFNVSGVTGTPNAGGSYELKKQEEQKMGAIPMTSGTQPQQTDASKPKEFNTFGKDIANFEKFKGNDKNDAMRITNEAANDVKKAYMQLQHEFPDVVIEFESMPDPTKCGKKREGFFNYQQQLSAWKDMAMTQIANERERSTEELVHGTAGQIIANDNANAEMNAAVTIATGEAIIENDNRNADEINANVDREGALTRKVVHQEGAYTRRTVEVQGAMTRNLVSKEAAETRDVVHQEGASTRNTVRNTAQQTQELGALSQKVSDVLTNGYKPHTNKTVKAVGAMRDDILASNLSFEEKKELLDNLANFADQVVLSDSELEEKHNEIQKRISQGGSGSQNEFYIPNPLGGGIAGVADSAVDIARKIARKNIQ